MEDGRIGDFLNGIEQMFSMGRVMDFVNKQGLKYWREFDLKTPKELSHYHKLYDPRLDYPIK